MNTNLEDTVPEANTAVTSSPPTSPRCCRRGSYMPFCRNTMFWLALMATAFMIAGIIAPGWLRVYARLEHSEDYHYSEFLYIYGFQDYGLWGVTQCLKKDTDTETYTCDTRSYNLLANLGDNSKMAWLALEGAEFSDICFSGVRLIFTYESMWILQLLYVTGTLVSVLNVFMAFELHSKSTRKFCSVMCEQTVIAFSFIPAALTFIPVFVFVGPNIHIKLPDRGYGGLEVTTFGLVFAGIGSAIMFIYAVAMLIHTRFCSCTEVIQDEPEVDVEDGQQKEQLCEAQLEEQD